MVTAKFTYSIFQLKLCISDVYYTFCSSYPQNKFSSEFNNQSDHSETVIMFGK